MRRWYALLLAVALAAGAGAFVWWAPWSSGPDVIAHARTQFGTRPVVHVVARDAMTPQPIVTGESTEVWYSDARRRVHFVVRRADKVWADAVLKVPQNPSVRITPPAPLDEFVKNYRTDLVNRRLRVEGEARIEGRRVLWLQSRYLAVAVDPVSYQPIWIRRPGSNRLMQLVVAETLPFDPVYFLTLKQRKARHL